MGGYQSSPRFAVRARNQLQLDPYVLHAPSDRRCRGRRLPHLALRGPHHGLVQGGDEEGVFSFRGSWCQERADHLQLLQEIWLQDHCYGCIFQKRWRDHGTGWLRLLDDRSMYLPNFSGLSKVTGANIE